VSGRLFVKAFVWLFMALSLVALMSPPGATQDEWFHASSIWCAQGVREPYCSEIGLISDFGFGARTNLDAFNCQSPPRQELYCPTERESESVFLANYGLYPKAYYYLMSFFVIPSVEQSIVLMRVVSALVITLVLGLTMWLLPSRYRIALFLVVLTTFPVTGSFLFASINPSGWTAFGTGVSWLALHAALGSETCHRRQKLLLAVASALAGFMAIGSRWDGVFFLALAATLVVGHLSWLRFVHQRRTVALVWLCVPLVSLYLLERFAVLSPWEHLRVLFTFSEGQPDNIAFLSYQLLQGLPNALGAFGSVPSMTPIEIPQIVYVLSLGVLAFLMIQTFNRSAKLQALGVAVVVVVISAVIAVQVAMTDSRDVGAIEPRYSYPLLIFGVGWWFLLGPQNLAETVVRYLKSAAVFAVVAFSLTTFTVTERFVDRQTFGFRWLPEAPDQWWWSWVPFGPNVVVILAPVCLWFFYRNFLKSQKLPAK
jgi:hypothetical protein